jgi:DNA gyrase subunit A
MATELLADIEKETVDFSPNYDDSELEPTVLPAKYPQLLVNGSGGIAVGMATNIPPHNLGEIIDATILLIRKPEVTIDDLMVLVPGPDFPTGGLIYGRSGIEQAYKTGRGSIVMRGKSTVEKTQKGDREQLVITEIPYQVNKARLVQKIAECIRDKRIEGISEVRDESDREGMRIVVELKKDVFPQVVQNQLFRLTDLQSSFGVINLSIAGGRPAVLNLKQTLEHFVEHRREVVSRRTRYELRQAEAQLELVEGLGVATGDIDRVVETIRKSKDPEEAKINLMALPLMGLEALLVRAGQPEAEVAKAKERGAYHLSERQAKAILEMRLARLTGLERDKLAKEYAELVAEITRLRAILGDIVLLMNVIVMELEDIKARFADARRTEIVAAEAEIDVEDLIQEEDMVVTISHGGYLKRTPVSEYRAQRRGGKGKIGAEARDEDWISQIFVASTHTFVFFFSDRGKTFVKKVYEIPQAPRTAKGRALVNFVGVEQGEKIAAITPVPGFDAGHFVVTLTKNGQIKKTATEEYENYRDKGIIGVKIEDGDQLLSAAITDGKKELLIATKRGMSIRFPEEQVRPTGRSTMGVKGIELEEGDAVVGLCVASSEEDRVLAVCERGYGKQTPLGEFRLQSRGGKGVILIDASDRNGPVVGICVVDATTEREVLVVTDQGQMLRVKASEIRETGRNAQGVRLMSVADDERVVGVEVVDPGPAPDGGTASSPPPSSPDGASDRPSDEPPPSADGPDES